MTEETLKSYLRDIKQSFFAYRNGVVADALKTVMPYTVVFGLQVPQLAEIARSLPADRDLAQRLWQERHVRESRLLATYLFPAVGTTLEEALELSRDVATHEEADMLAFRLLKRMQDPAAVLKLMEEDSGVDSYTVATLRNHIS